MYKTVLFEKQLCRLFKEFDIASINRDCNVFSIWSFCPSDRWTALKRLFTNCEMCRAEWFPLIFWVVLVISAFGSFYSLSEFTGLYFGDRKRISVWRRRRYFIVTYAMVRKCRLVGALVMINVWIMLLYGVVRAAPMYMTPWLVINSFVLAYEIVSFIWEVLLGATCVDVSTLVTFALSITNYVFVSCVKKTFDDNIKDMIRGQELRLW